MVKLVYKLEIVEGNIYFLQVQITDDTNEKLYKTITKSIPFNDFMKTLQMSDEERDIRTKAEEIMKKVLFENMSRILQNEVVEEVDKITKLEEAKILLNPMEHLNITDGTTLSTTVEQ
jgi:hypothetical protein